MKRTWHTWLTAGILLLLVSCSRQDQQTTGGQASHSEATTSKTAYYTCPMHTSVRSDRPGVCPICGMQLVRRSATSQQPSGEPQEVAAVSISPRQRVMANVATGAVAWKSMQKTIDAVGVVEEAETGRTLVTARFNGRVERLYVNFAGDVVRRGEAMFSIYSPDLASAEQEFILSLAQAESTRAITPSAGVPEDPLVRAHIDRLIHRFGLTTRQVEDIQRIRTIRPTLEFLSPAAGTVTSKQVREGQYVNEGETLYELADLSRVWVNVDVYESDLRFVKKGDRVEIRSEAFPGETLTGRVTFISPAVDAEARTVRVRAEFANPKGALRPQMFVRARMVAPALKRLAIPSTAVLSSGDNNLVWVEIRENTFVPREVSLGVQSNGWVEILSGVKEHEVVAVSGGYLLDSESKLQLGGSGHQHETGGVQPARPSSPPDSLHPEHNAGQAPGHVHGGKL